MLLVRCEDVALILPRAVDVGEPVDESVQHHVNSCLTCQAELAKYHKLLKALRTMRHQLLIPAPGTLAMTLAALQESQERRAIRSLVGAGEAPTSAPSAAPPWRPARPPPPWPWPGAGPPAWPGSPSPAGGGGLPVALARMRAAILHWRPQARPRAVAQLAEHRSPKPTVGGSIPSCPALPAPIEPRRL